MMGTPEGARGHDPDDWKMSPPTGWAMVHAQEGEFPFSVFSLSEIINPRGMSDDWQMLISN